MTKHMAGAALWMAMALLLTSCGGSTKTAPADVARLEQEVRDVDTAFPNKVAARDTEAIVEAYADDALILAPGSAMAKGKEGARKLWTGLLRIPDLSLSLEDERVFVSQSGDLGVAVGRYTMRYRSPRGSVEDVGKFITIYRRTGNDWKIVVDTFNSDKPPSQGG